RKDGARRARGGGIHRILASGKYITPGRPRAPALLEERLRELVGPLVPGFDRDRVRFDAQLGLVAQVLAAVELLEGGDGDRPGRSLVALQAPEQERDARSIAAAHERVTDVEPEVLVSFGQVLFEDLRELLVARGAHDARRGFADSGALERALEGHLQLA